LLVGVLKIEVTFLPVGHTPSRLKVVLWNVASAIPLQAPVQKRQPAVTDYVQPDGERLAEVKLDKIDAYSSCTIIPCSRGSSQVAVSFTYENLGLTISDRIKEIGCASCRHTATSAAALDSMSEMCEGLTEGQH